MHPTRAMVALGAVLAGFAGLVSVGTSSHPSGRIVARTAVAAPAVVTGDVPELAAAKVLADLDGVYRAEVAREVGAYLDALEQTRLAAEAAARAAAARLQTAPVLRTGNCCGPHSDAWWWGVAICEQGGRNDPYFGYFSFMDGSQGGRSWEEQVAAGNALLSRVSSESPAWAPACVAAGYRASPGG